MHVCTCIQHIYMHKISILLEREWKMIEVGRDDGELQYLTVFEITKPSNL